MNKTAQFQIERAEKQFLNLYRMVREREESLTNDAKIVQYGAVLRYFMKFLQSSHKYSSAVLTILYRIDVKLGDIYYEEALQNQDNSRYFFAAEYYTQALSFAREQQEKQYVLVALKNVYYSLNDENALIQVEKTWAENHSKKDRYTAFMLLAQNSSDAKIKAMFLSSALNEVMEQEESFYDKYQDTLDVCSQLAVLYDLLGEKEKAVYVKNLRQNTLKLLN
jgi:hypothetical protein